MLVQLRIFKRIGTSEHSRYIPTAGGVHKESSSRTDGFKVGSVSPTLSGLKFSGALIKAMGSRFHSLVVR